MSSIDEIVNELLAIESEISMYEVRIQREQGEITNTMNKAQYTFGNQRAGQNMVSTLYKTLQNMVIADSSLNCVKQGIHDYIQNLQK